jgi:hypothetical protein
MDDVIQLPRDSATARRLAASALRELCKKLASRATRFRGVNRNEIDR